MTSKEFVIWLQGFTQGIEEYNITPTPLQWNVIKGKLAEINDGQPIGVGGLGVPNTQPFPRWQEPHTYVYTGDPIPCASPNGTVPATGFIVTTSPGTTITTTPNGMSTSITYGYPSGSAWSYTSTQKEPTQTSERQLLTDNID
jgi:hypothetical protein